MVLEQDLERPSLFAAATRPELMMSRHHLVAATRNQHAICRDVPLELVEQRSELSMVGAQHRDIDVRVLPRLPSEINIDRPTAGDPPRDRERCEHLPRLVERQRMPPEISQRTPDPSWPRRGAARRR